MHDLSGRYCRCCRYNIWDKGNHLNNAVEDLIYTKLHFSLYSSVACFYVCFMVSPQHFNLKLSQFGPYRVDYGKTGRLVTL